MAERGAGRGSIRGGRVIKVPQPTHTNGEVPFVAPLTLPYQFQQDLDNYISCGKGSIVNLTISYIGEDIDYDLFVNKVIDASLKSPIILTDLVESIKLICELNNHGPKIKFALFTQLETRYNVFQNLKMEYLPKLREKFRNTCDLIGQLYFRFRVTLKGKERYSHFETPTIECMKYLLNVNKQDELIIFVKLINMNYLALCRNHKEDMNEMSNQIRNHIYKPSKENNKELPLLMCALECINYQGTKFPEHLFRYYEDLFKSHWQGVAPYARRRLLLELPKTFWEHHKDKFNISMTTYTENAITDFSEDKN